MNELLAAALVVGAVRSPRLLARYPEPLARPLVAAVGTLALAYGGREFLRGFGGGYYCCSHLYYGLSGFVLVIAGWVAIVPALGVGPWVRRDDFDGAGARGDADDSKRSP
ncbi:hypothetical protein [Halobaculum gomorrense]|uniref:Uncharacterized protein n=1 Tax=Halobaculum gomorrense TaxID=43928 RepID=A0A1M5JTA1_9EURY|nr:hypothetical protein [Halobaculum gomorrense]SHG43748.1 hypothetical protein SAMN05443636_0258 [Halobaculum gomorrense]